MHMLISICLLIYRTNCTHNVKFLANDLGPEMQCSCDADQSGGEGEGRQMFHQV